MERIRGAVAALGISLSRERWTVITGMRGWGTSIGVRHRAADVRVITL